MNPPRLLGGVLFLILGLTAAFLIHALRMSPRIHDVAPGDTLFSIACHYYGDGHLYSHIAESNDLSAPYLLKPKERLLIPRPTEAFSFMVILAAAAVITLIGFTADVPAFSAAERILGGSGNSLRAFIAAAATAVFTGASLLWLLAVWGFAGRSGVMLILPLLWLVTGVLRLRALSPVFEGDIKRTALTWGMARLMSGTAILALLLLATAFTGERVRPILATLSLIAPR